MMSNIRMRHHGYSTMEELKRKEERNLRIAMAMPDDDLHSLHCRARAAMTLSRWQLAHDSARALLKLDCMPLAEVEGWVMLGVASFFLKKLDDLDEAIEQAAQIAPGNPDVRYLEFIRAGRRYHDSLLEGGKPAGNEYLRCYLIAHSAKRTEAVIALLLGDDMEIRTESET